MSETLRGLDDYLTTEPDPYAGQRRVPCDRCTGRWAQYDEVGPFRESLCGPCYDWEMRPAPARPRGHIHTCNDCNTTHRTLAEAEACCRDGRKP